MNFELSIPVTVIPEASGIVIFEPKLNDVDTSLLSLNGVLPNTTTWSSVFS